VQLNVREWGAGERWALLIHGVAADANGWGSFTERREKQVSAWRPAALRHACVDGTPLLTAARRRGRR
jgi:hypothetical protein